MLEHDHDDGLVHGHDWARSDCADRDHPTVAAAWEVPTVSSALHDDMMH